MVRGDRDLKKVARTIQAQTGESYTKAREMAKEVLESGPGTLGERAGVEVQFHIDPDPFPYKHQDQPVTAQVVLPDGTVVYAGDEGSRLPYTLKDGTQTEPGWIIPTKDVPPGEDPNANGLLTKEQFDLLCWASKMADEFVPGEVPESEYDQIPLGRLRELVDEYVSTLM